MIFNYFKAIKGIKAISTGPDTFSPLGEISLCDFHYDGMIELN